MKGIPLIDHIAQGLVEKAGGGLDLSGFAVVFPGKRPSVYLRKRLGEILDHPFHPPSIFSVDEFMAYLAMSGPSPIPRIGSRAEALSAAFDVTRRLLSHVGPSNHLGLKDFIYWGLELIDAFEELFTGLVDATELERAIFASLEIDQMGERQRHLFTHLPGLYQAFEEELIKRGIVTRGLAYKLASKTASTAPLPFRHFTFAGFAFETKAEQAVFTSLFERYPVEKIQDPMGIPLEDWLTKAPRMAIQTGMTKFHAGGTLHEELVLMKACIEEGLKRHGWAPEETVVVLPEPSSLMPTIQWVLEHLGCPYNVSMGYPAQRTPMGTLLMDVLTVQEEREGAMYFVPGILKVLGHPYVRARVLGDAQGEVLGAIRGAVEKTKRTFMTLEDLEALCGHVEGIKRAKDCLFTPFEGPFTVGRLAKNLMTLMASLHNREDAAAYPFQDEAVEAITNMLLEVESCGIKDEPIDPQCAKRLFGLFIKGLRVPFKGLPLKGIQVLGTLETRCLHFKNVLILDLNEGALPPKTRPNPLLPQSLRRKLGLPNAYNDAEISRHHIFNLMRKGENVHIFWQEGPDALRSRYVEELIWEIEKTRRKIGLEEVERINPPIHKAEKEVFKGEKTQNVAEMLKGYRFSPASIDTYHQCPYKFYLKYVEKIPEDSEDCYKSAEDEITPSEIGDIVHAALERFYRGTMGVGGEILPMEKKEIEGDLSPILEHLFEEKFGPKEEWTATVSLLKKIVENRLVHFISKDTESSKGHVIIGLEKDIDATIHVKDGLSLVLKGRVDRIQKDISGTYWVMDYKTGTPPSIPRDYTKEAVLEMDSLQIPIYLYLLRHSLTRGKDTNEASIQWRHLNGAILALKGMDAWTSSKALKLPFFKDQDLVESAMEELLIPHLRGVLLEILDPKVPFYANPINATVCNYCGYRTIGCRYA